jgi:hypothetical protein
MYRPRWYILNDDKSISPVRDVSVWANWRGNDDGKHVVAHTMVNEDVFVSTVFMGLDHRIFGKGEPILFETMIFGGEHNGYQERCCTWNQALKEHSIACGMVEGKISRYGNGKQN